MQYEFCSDRINKRIIKNIIENYLSNDSSRMGPIWSHVFLLKITSLSKYSLSQVHKMFRLNQDLLNILTYWYYIDNFLEILYANPMATNRVIIPADIVIIRFVLITWWNKIVLIIAGTAIIIASNVPLRKIFSIEIFASFFSEFESNFTSDNSKSYKNPSQ